MNLQNKGEVEGKAPARAAVRCGRGRAGLWGTRARGRGGGCPGAVRAAGRGRDPPLQHPLKFRQPRVGRRRGPD